MPNSSETANPVAGEMKEFLHGILPDARLTDAPVPGIYSPLLLMQTDRIMAAFAFANGDVHKSYEALYGTFKRYYSEQRAQMDSLDLAFVFCVQPGTAQLERFCSTVETDVYFCRKFVVILGAPLSASLARLPFIPLTQLYGHSLRPASAQIFLQQCNVPAVLARYLVVQHVRSPDGIIEDCTNGKFGEPGELAAVGDVAGSPMAAATDPVCLEAIEIQNFRAYRASQTFRIGADVTVLYGPNGFGKTSFFDAVDFAVTGGIGRIGTRHEAAFAKTAQHLDSGSDESMVSLRFSTNGVIRSLSRSVASRAHALLDDRPTDRKALLSEITGRDVPANERVENLVSLFRATHLFSQEQQEFTKDLKDDCQLSAQIVSRMLAVEDYANAVTKATRVRDTVRTSIADASREIRELTGQLAAERDELERLGRAAGTHTNTNALDADFERLRLRLSASGIEVSPKPPNAAALRGWRASVESRHAECVSRSARFTELVSAIAGLGGLRVKLASEQQRHSATAQALGAAEQRLATAEQSLQQQILCLAEITAKRGELQARAECFETVRRLRPLYSRLVERARGLGIEVGLAEAELVKARTSEGTAAAQLRSEDAAAAQIHSMADLVRADVSELQRLEETLPVWAANQGRIAVLRQSEEAEKKVLEDLFKAERGLSTRSTAAVAEEACLVRQIAEVDKSQTELRTLVSLLQGHVHAGACPLCGEDYGSKAQLLLRIQRHVAADSATETRAELIRVRELVAHLAEEIVGNKQSQEASTAQLLVLTEERNRLEGAIAGFVSAADRLGVPTEAYQPIPLEQVRDRRERAQQHLAELNRQGEDAKAAVETARAALVTARNQVSLTNVRLTECRVALLSTQEESNRLAADPRLHQLALDIEPDDLAKLERVHLEALDKVKTEAAVAEGQLTELRVEVAALRKEATALRTQQATLRARATAVQAEITQVTVRLDEAGLPADIDENGLLDLIAAESRVQIQLSALREQASNLEMALDAATTAAALTSLQQRIRNKERAVARAESVGERLRPWLKYFEEVSRRVASKQNDAIASFTGEYGPLTSVIQRRLRSVYGFDDIELRSHEAAISVRVKRQGEELRPTDYFSQSQQQTLALGLFLTACSSQTWSSFCPVFLDDPVTHFDDLNTYAFLDLLVGMLESDSGRRQFVISTCDEKLLHLARQKFRHLGDRATFYRFGAIGPEGPLVESINVQ